MDRLAALFRRRPTDNNVTRRQRPVQQPARQPFTRRVMNLFRGRRPTQENHQMQVSNATQDQVRWEENPLPRMPRRQRRAENSNVVQEQAVIQRRTQEPAPEAPAPEPVPAPAPANLPEPVTTNTVEDDGIERDERGRVIHPFYLFRKYGSYTLPGTETGNAFRAFSFDPQTIMQHEGTTYDLYTYALEPQFQRQSDAYWDQVSQLKPGTDIARSRESFTYQTYLQCLKTKKKMFERGYHVRNGIWYENTDVVHLFFMPVFLTRSQFDRQINSYGGNTSYESYLDGNDITMGLRLWLESPPVDYHNLDTVFPIVDLTNGIIVHPAYITGLNTRDKFYLQNFASYNQYSRLQRVYHDIQFTSLRWEGYQELYHIEQIPERRTPVVDSVQVHRAFSTINVPSLTELLTVANSRIVPDLWGTYNNAYVVQQVREILEQQPSIFDNAEDHQRIGQLLNHANYGVLTKLGSSNDQSPREMSILMAVGIEFVRMQPKEFQRLYIEIFAENSANAYRNDPTSSHDISCLNGIKERIVTSIGDACMGYCSIDESKCQEGGLYAKIIKTLNGSIDMNALYQAWIVEMERDPVAYTNMKLDQRQKSLFEFLKNGYRKFLGESTYQSQKRQLEANFHDYIQPLEDALKRDLDEDNKFVLGGGSGRGKYNKRYKRQTVGRRRCRKFKRYTRRCKKYRKTTQRRS